MPAIIVHDLFGKDVMDAFPEPVDASGRARQAFLLGNQGPDPLFYLVMHPLRMKRHMTLSQRMHGAYTPELLMAFKKGAESLEGEEREIGRAYIAGFLCHYLLDSTVHPFVYAQQYALCGEDAEKPYGKKTHIAIERALDEITLYRKLETTVEFFKPYINILQADDQTLRALGKIYAYVAEEVFQSPAPASMYPLAVKSFRFGQKFFYSHNKWRGRIIPSIETKIFRARRSFYEAISHRAVASSLSPYSNEAGAPWTSPFTGAESTASFWELYQNALGRSGDAIKTYLSDSFSEDDALRMARGVDFLGKPLR